MIKSFIVGVAVLFVLCFTVNNVFATNITIYDGAGTGTGWHGAQEDNEVEPGCVGTQVWDLEAFLLNGSNLTMVGGFDFKNGVPGYDGVSGAKDFTSGDIFVDVVGDTTGYIANGHSYEYAIDLDFGGTSYNVYDLGSNPIIDNVYYGQNAGSNPWQYDITKQVGTPAPAFSGILSYVSDAQTEFLGGTHYTVELDGLDSDLIAAGNTFHFTMGCGNDNLMGQVPVPEPCTLLLLGMGFLGAVTFKRKKFA